MFEIDTIKYPMPSKKRHHTNPSFYFPLKYLKITPYNYPMPIEKIDWSEFFLNSKPPNILDIGCGRGLFLLTVAVQNPTSNILGVEIREWCCEWLRNYISSESIVNCAILRYCIGNGLQFIDAETVDEIFYLFPDPWFKNKHKKRRAFNLKFLDDVFRMLKNKGKLYLATDKEEVHQYHKKSLEKFGKMKFLEIKTAEEWNKPLTNQEIFCREKEIQYYRIIAEKG
jgi:tRNA (guanine-N7-)-methyltransferase